MNYKNYVGFDVSHTAIDLCKSKFKNSNHRFTNSISELPDSSDCTISLDVLYHLVEDDVYHQYLTDLFEKSSNHVVVYSSNFNSYSMPHVRHREFLEDIKNRFPQFDNYQILPTPSYLKTTAKFYFFRKGK